MPVVTVEDSPSDLALQSAVAPSRPFRVLIVMPLAERRGGAEWLLTQLLEDSVGGEVDWTVAFLQDGPMVEEARRWHVDALVVDAGRLRHPRRMARAIKALAGIARSRQVDLVLSWMGKPQLYGGPAALLAGVKACWFQHGLSRRFNFADRLATFLPAAGVLTCSEMGKAAQRRLLPRRDTRVVYPGVDLNRFDPDALPTPTEARHALGLPGEGPLVGMVGRLQSWKGMHHLIEALPNVLQANPTAHCVIVGGSHAYEPGYESFVRRLVERLGLEQNVTLAGLRHDIPLWMQAMDVVVHASNSEPFGMVVVEAMALGKPAVASNNGGPTEIISDGVNGLLWRFPDSQDLARKINWCFAEPAAAANMGVMARRRAERFSVRRFREDLIRELRCFAGNAALQH